MTKKKKVTSTGAIAFRKFLKDNNLITMTTYVPKALKLKLKAKAKKKGVTMNSIIVSTLEKEVKKAA